MPKKNKKSRGASGQSKINGKFASMESTQTAPGNDEDDEVLSAENYDDAVYDDYDGYGDDVQYDSDGCIVDGDEEDDEDSDDEGECFMPSDDAESNLLQTAWTHM